MGKGSMENNWEKALYFWDVSLGWTPAAADSLQHIGLEKETHLCKNKEKPNQVQLPSPNN